MALYSVRSERQFCEQLDYNLLFRWFLDMDMTEASLDATAFTHNRARLVAHDVAGEFFRAVVDQATAGNLMSSDHFTVDGTLIEAAASLKSFKRKDDDDTKPPDDTGNPTVDFHGEKRGNATHESKTDPDAKLARKGKGKEAKLSYSAHALMENRNGLLVGFELDTADGYAERRAALDLVDNFLPGKRRITLGADKGYDTRDFVAACRDRNITPHVAQKTRYSALDARTSKPSGYAISQRIRKRVEEVFGWMKTVGGYRSRGAPVALTSPRARMSSREQVVEPPSIDDSRPDSGSSLEVAGRHDRRQRRRQPRERVLVGPPRLRGRRFDG